MSDDHQFNEPQRSTENKPYLAQKDAANVARLRESHAGLLEAAIGLLDLLACLPITVSDARIRVARIAIATAEEVAAR
jgi:hypothetical protein